MITVEYWQNTRDGYDNRYEEVDTSDEAEAILVAKQRNRFGKNFKIYKTE